MNSWQKRRLFICFISVFAVWRKPNSLKGLKFNVPWNLLSSSNHSWFSDLWSRQITIPTYNQEKTNDGTDDEWQKLSAYTAIVYKEKVNKMLGLNFTLLPVLEKRRMDFFLTIICFRHFWYWSQLNEVHVRKFVHVLINLCWINNVS